MGKILHSRARTVCIRKRFHRLYQILEGTCDQKTQNLLMCPSVGHNFGHFLVIHFAFMEVQFVCKLCRFPIFLYREVESRHFAHNCLKPNIHMDILTQGFCTYLVIIYTFVIVTNNNLYSLMCYKHFSTLHSIQKIIVSP